MSQEYPKHTVARPHKQQKVKLEIRVISQEICIMRYKVMGYMVMKTSLAKGPQ